MDERVPYAKRPIPIAEANAKFCASDDISLDFDSERPLDLEVFVEFLGRTGSRIGTVGFALNEPNEGSNKAFRK